MSSPLHRFGPAVRAWFEEALGEPTPAQVLAWEPICEGRSTLVLAPTGSGKTLAAFLAAIDRLLTSPEPAKEARCRVLYVSPLKALAVDVEKNLRVPIAGTLAVAERMGAALRRPTADLRTGDTPQSERARMARTPPDILITTPESFYLLLTSRARRILDSVEVVILDEIHSLLPTKRGAHLFLSLERLEEGRARPLQRIGLSATARPIEEVRALLGGFDDEGRRRPVTVVDAGARKDLTLSTLDPGFDQKDGTLWPHIHAKVAAIVKEHRSAMIFVNSRRLAERFAQGLNEASGSEVALAHHGSIARETRKEIEDKLKSGELRAIVATSSLELGIDMGAVDVVVQIEAPWSVSSGLQRIGRACHQVGGVPRGFLVPKHKGDLLACAAAARSIALGQVEAMAYPRNALDVLAQQLVAIVASREERTAEEALYRLVRRAAPYADLPRGTFEGVLEMLAGLLPESEASELRPRLVWDRTSGTLRGRTGALKVAVANGGTIPDRGLYGVFLPTGRRVGELDEEMVFELREGEVFLLGASSWRAEEITHDRVVVTPAAGEPGKMPFWHGDRRGRSRAFGEAVGALTRRVADSLASQPSSPSFPPWLVAEHALTPAAASALVAYVADQRARTGEAPSDRCVVVERMRDELGDFRVVVLTPFGAPVHAPWAIAVEARFQRDLDLAIDVHTTDDGMVFRVPQMDLAPDARLFFPPSDEVEADVTAALSATSLFGARFRECASRALLLPRRSVGRRTPLFAQRRRAHDLLAAVSRFPSFPIVLETYRECLRDAFDLPGLVEILRTVESKEIRVATADTQSPSPFSANVLFSFVASFIYDADAPAAERRAQALTIDHHELRAILGETELRKLLDPEVLRDHEEGLQRRRYPVRDADDLHDLLRAIGELDRQELVARGAGEALWRAVVAEGRGIWVRVAGAERLAAVEDAGRLCGALGIALPAEVPAPFRDPGDDPVGERVLRYARTHGPFVAGDLVKRLGVGEGAAATAIAALIARGLLVEGEFLPDGAGPELCNKEVLDALRRKSLARLRREVEPVPPEAFARFLLAWQSVDRPRAGGDALLSAIGQLEGAVLAFSALESEILPARVEGYRPWDLDALCASGEVVWAGIGALGAADAKIALYLTEHEALLARRGEPASGELPARIRSFLEQRGAVFFADVVRAVGGFPNDVLAALYALVWAGEVTNDTLEPLRARLTAGEAHDGRRERLLARRVSRGLPGSEGRWSLRRARWTSLPSDTERRAAVARALLERYGVVTREVALAEEWEGGFSAVYEVLRAMEDTGRVRRGYFIDGRGGAQFALPGADERLRARRDPARGAVPHGDVAQVLAATDPANPYGAALEWPVGPPPRPQRSAGALVIVHQGALVGWLGRSEEALLTFIDDADPRWTHRARALAAALGDLVDRGQRRVLLIATIDGGDARGSRLAPFFEGAGFTRGARALQRRPALTSRSRGASSPPARRPR